MVAQSTESLDILVLNFGGCFAERREFSKFLFVGLAFHAGNFLGKEFVQFPPFVLDQVFEVWTWFSVFFLRFSGLF